jgi:hypothetical protein
LFLMFYISSLTSPCRCGRQQHGRRREVAVCGRGQVTGSIKMRANCSASVRLPASSNSLRWLRLSYVSAGVRLTCCAAASAGQNAYSAPPSLALITRSLVRRQCALLLASSAESLNLPSEISSTGQYRPNAGSRQASIACSDVKGVGP